MLMTIGENGPSHTQVVGGNVKTVKHLKTFDNMNQKLLTVKFCSKKSSFKNLAKANNLTSIHVCMCVRIMFSLALFIVAYNLIPIYRDQLYNFWHILAIQYQVTIKNNLFNHPFIKYLLNVRCITSCWGSRRVQN